MKSLPILVLFCLLWLASISTGEPVQAPMVLENVAVTFSVSGWNHRTWEKQSFVLQADGKLGGLWAESGSFSLTTAHRQTPDGTFQYRPLPETGRAELVLSLDGTQTPLVKQLRFNSATHASVLNDDIYAHPESMQLSGMGGDQEMLNLSNRVEVSAGGAAHTGFVLGTPGHYLIRVVGPTLREFGVGDGVASPSLKMHKVGLPEHKIVFEAGFLAPSEVTRRAAQLVGAFPLIQNGEDVALIVRLYPGTYVAEALNPTDQSGQLMIELYALPF